MRACAVTPPRLTDDIPEEPVAAYADDVRMATSSRGDVASEAGGDAPNHPRAAQDDVGPWDVPILDISMANEDDAADNVAAAGLAASPGNTPATTSREASGPTPAAEKRRPLTTCGATNAAAQLGVSQSTQRASWHGTTHDCDQYPVAADFSSPVGRQARAKDKLRLLGHPEEEIGEYGLIIVPLVLASTAPPPAPPPATRLRPCLRMRIQASKKRAPRSATRGPKRTPAFCRYMQMVLLGAQAWLGGAQARSEECAAG